MKKYVMFMTLLVSILVGSSVFAQTVQQITYNATTVAFDPSYSEGSVTLTGDLGTFTVTNGTLSQQAFAFQFCQDNTGGHKIKSGPANFSGALDLSLTPNWCTTLYSNWMGRYWLVTKRVSALQTSSGSGTSLPSTTGIFKGNGSGGASAAIVCTDYLTGNGNCSPTFNAVTVTNLIGNSDGQININNGSTAAFYDSGDICLSGCTLDLTPDGTANFSSAAYIYPDGTATFAQGGLVIGPQGSLAWSQIDNDAGYSLNVDGSATFGDGNTIIDPSGNITLAPGTSFSISDGAGGFDSNGNLIAYSIYSDLGLVTSDGAGHIVAADVGSTDSSTTGNHLVDWQGKIGSDTGFETNRAVDGNDPLTTFSVDAPSGNTYIGGSITMQSTAPAGTCPQAGAWILSGDGHATYCPSNGGSWTTKI